jgi:hypothetical protein
MSLKLARPGFGPGLKPLGRTVPARCHGGCRSRVALQKEMRGSRRATTPNTWALAVQLSSKAVSPTKDLDRRRGVHLVSRNTPSSWRAQFVFRNYREMLRNCGSHVAPAFGRCCDPNEARADWYDEYIRPKAVNRRHPVFLVALDVNGARSDTYK